MNIQSMTYLNWQILFFLFVGLDVPDIACHFQISERLVIRRIARLFPDCYACAVKT